MRLRTVVACAGIGVRKLTLDVTDEELRSVLDVNLYGLMTTFRVFAPLALKQPGARFIAISSLNAIQGMRLRAPYSRRQGGVDGFVRALAFEWGPLGATVNSVAPGIIVTPMTRGYMDANPERREAGLAHTPVGRLERRMTLLMRSHSWLPKTRASSMAIRSLSMAVCRWEIHGGKDAPRRRS